MERIRLRFVRGGDTWAVWSASADRRTQTAPFRWRTDGSYLISGGLGDLGLLVARWMVEQGARRLILLGRTQLPPRANWSSVETGSRLARQIAAIRELESLGASVHLGSVDVADEGELSAFWTSFAPRVGRRSAASCTRRACCRTDCWCNLMRGAGYGFAAKGDGWLAAASPARRRSLGLLRTLLFRGFPAGPARSGELCRRQRFPGCAGASPTSPGPAGPEHQLGRLGRLGFADTAGGKRLAARLALLGISSIAPQQALEVLGRLLRQDATQVVAVPVDWRQYREFYPRVLNRRCSLNLHVSEPASNCDRTSREEKNRPRCPPCRGTRANARGYCNPT